MKKKVLISLLPTNKVISEDDLISFGNTLINGCRISTPNDTVTFISPLDNQLQNFVGIDRFNAYYLCFTSDEEIRIGDWCLLFDSFGNLFSETPQQYLGEEAGHQLNDGLRKVVATNNPELFNTSENAGKLSYNIIGRIDDAFLNDYAKAYNEKKLLTEVELEYEYSSKEFIGYVESYGSIQEPILKLRQNGSVIIHSTEERVHTREEFKNAVEKAWFSNDHAIISFEEWFNQRYPK